MRTYTRRHKVDMVKLSIGAAIFISILVGLALYAMHFPRANAASGQVNAQQVTLNPGGGVLSNGTDGLRFTINSLGSGESSHEYDYANDGQDGVVYRGTYQYCCSAGAPLLNIGGQLYGQAGPAYSAPTWDSIEVISTSGATSVGTRTPATGDSSATVRYSVEHDGLTYTMDRTVSYLYPNDFVTDSYSFVIPAGNTQEVKFYLGGDTAPGSSDSGYGIMLTDPVRSVISLNIYSHIMFGFREIQGARPFDGATSQAFYTPYDTVSGGGDIGFVGTTSVHDAGLMMQWDLGSTPGTYTGSLEQFSTLQGTNLNATLAESFSEVEGVVDLNISIVNSELDPVSGLGYSLTLPAGLLIDDVATSSCGGTLTATPGSGLITLSGVTVAAASNCVVSLPVSAAVAGAYTITSASVSGITGVLTNNVGVSTLNVGVYTLSYATQGGTSISSVYTEQGNTVVVPSTTRSGYTFTGWNTLPNGSGTAYLAGSNFTMPANNTTLYARWQAIPYTLTFSEQGGDSVADLSNLTVGTVVELPGASRTNYQFVGWNTASNGSGTLYGEGDDFTIPAGNTTLYAIWGREVILAFDGQFGDSYGEFASLVGDEFTAIEALERPGYTFIEWNTSPFGTGSSLEADETFTTPNVDTTYYAIWEDSDGISLAIENAAPNNGDANNDGYPDSSQASVSSFVNSETGKPVTLSVESDEGCLVADATIAAASSLGSDGAYEYPLGLLNFSATCGDPGFTATIKQYFYDPPEGEFAVRKFSNGRFVAVEGATVTYQTIAGRQVLVVTYDVTDGGPLDEDGEVNGTIIDPAGPAVLSAATPNTGIKGMEYTSSVLSSAATGLVVAFVTVAAGFGVVKIFRKNTRK